MLIRLTIRALKSPAYFLRVRERFGYYKSPPGTYKIWIHAVSVGEVNAAGPLARELQRLYPNEKILLTTMTPTGADQARISFGERIDHLYLPYDYPFAVRRFINRIQPKLAIMMETEIWPNFIARCHKQNIPLVIANLRLSDRSFRQYKKFSFISRPVFRKIAHFAVQTNADSKRIRAITKSPNNITVTGNIKFEVNLPASLLEVAQVVRREWGTNRTILVAGSTHEGEEEILLQVFIRLKKHHADLLLVLVPRHPERFDSVYKLIAKYKLLCSRRSTNHIISDAGIDVHLGDTMGELPTFYAASDIAFVGGSLVKIGGHNILEACALGKPVVFGKYMFNFLEISRMTLEQNAGIQVNDITELENELTRLIDDPSYRYSYGEEGIKLIKNNQGSLSNTIKAIQHLLPKTRVNNL